MADTTTKFDVIPGIIVYARLALENKKGPLTLTFKYQKGSDLSACLSTVKKLPDQMNCQQHKTKPHTMEIRTLTNEFLYLAFETEKGVSFTVDVKFNEFVRNSEKRVSYLSPAKMKLASLPTIEESPVGRDKVDMNMTNAENWMDIRKIKTVKQIVLN